MQRKGKAQQQDAGQAQQELSTTGTRLIVTQTSRVISRDEK